MTGHQEPTGSAGFTLIELLLAVAMSTILMGVLASAMITGLRGVRTTAETLKDSADAQALSSYLTQDIQSVAGATDVTLGSHGNDSACTTTSTDTGLFLLRWRGDDGSSTLRYSASYRWSQSTEATATGSFRRWRLLRYFCAKTSPASAANVTTVARDLADPTGAATKPTFASSSSSLTATFTDVQTDGSTYTFSVGGAFRAVVEDGAAYVPPPPPPTAPGEISTPSVQDKNSDGKMDTVQVLFTAPVPGACSTGWSVTGLPSGYSASEAMTLSGGRTSASMAITVPTGTSYAAYSTDATAVAVSLTNPASGCTITNANAAVPALDLAAPVGIPTLPAEGRGSAAGTEDGRMELGDALAIVFSEKVTGIPSAVTPVIITETSNPSGNDTLNVAPATGAPLTRAPADLGSKGYISNGKTVTAAGTLALKADGRTAVVTVTGLPVSATDLSNNGSKGIFKFVADSSVVDLAATPNAASSAAIPTSANFTVF